MTKLSIPRIRNPPSPQKTDRRIGGGVIPVMCPIAGAVVDNEDAVLSDRFDDPVFLFAVIGRIVNLLTDGQIFLFHW